MKIVKSPRDKASFKESMLIEVDPDDSEAIIEATMNPVKIDGILNQLTTLIPLQDDAKARQKEYLDYSGATQPIVFEFDHDTLDHQKQRALVIKEKITTPIYSIFSGHKSHHIVLLFQHFANNAKEYEIAWKKFYYYLSQEIPEYFTYCMAPKEKLLENDKVKYNQINWSLVPDISLRFANHYFRQALGYRR